jgi:hypothetical protein
MRISTIRHKASTTFTVIRFVLIIAILVATAIPHSANAMTKCQKRQFDNVNPHYNCADSVAPACATGATVLVGADPEEQAFNFYLSKGFSKPQAAGMVANLKQESGFNPKSDNGTHKGIAQWDIGGRWDKKEVQNKGDTKGKPGNMVAYATSVSKDPLDYATELEFTMIELNGDYKDSTLNPLKKVTGEQAAPEAKANGDKKYPPEQVVAYIVQSNYEIADSSHDPESVENNRRMVSASKILTNYQDNELPSGVAVSASGGCELNAEGGCDNSNANIIVQIACGEWKKKVIEVPNGSNCDPKGIISTYVAAGGNSKHCGEAWCSDFVIYVFKQAGFKPETNPAAESWRQFFEKKNAWTAQAANAAPPKPGDVVKYTFDSDHVGIIVSVDTAKHTMNTIEGNTGGGDDPIKEIRGSEGLHQHVGRNYYDFTAIDGWGDTQKVFGGQQ